MKIVYFGLLLLVAVYAKAETKALIYQPKILSPELKSDMDLKELKWQLGLTLGQVLPTSQNSSNKLGISANYLIWDKWYAAGNIGLSEWQITPKTTESAIAWSLGAGYSVLQGAAYITEGLTLPWQAYLELGIGEQVLDQTTSNLAFAALGWQLSNNNNYAALEWRYFQINDDRLKQINSDKGYEWSITFGKYF